MSAPLTVEIRGEALLARIEGAEQRLREGLRRAVLRLAIEAQGKVKAEKLTGQVLHVRTGTLRRSINQRVTETPDGVHASVGTNVEYARIHEYGFAGPVSVKAHTQLRKAVFGKALTNPRRIAIRAHSRNVKMPARPFLRPVLDEMAPRVITDLRTAALEALR